MLACILLCGLILPNVVTVYSYAGFGESDPNLTNVVLSLHQDYINRIEKLQNEFEHKSKIQNDRINSLEVELANQKECVTRLTKQLSFGDKEIERLQTHIRRLEDNIKVDKNPNHDPQRSSGMDSHTDKTKGNRNMTLNRTRSLGPTTQKYENHRKGRLLTSQSPSVSDVTTIAFYAYISADIPSTEATLHHVLIFDVVKTNVGNAYHPFSGIFIAPETGIYVFSWGIYNGGGSYHSAQLMVNADEVGVVHSHTVGTRNYAQSTGVVTCLVNKGDDVFLRLSDAYGAVSSNGSGRSFFTGWKLN